ncbi:hypothetical protein SAMN02800694_2627 [Luteibacter sp. UNCMF331Sha3.1]|uniref:hypothetical protein n=1 Tax=Luteibacter sp. UNCMF331Sha3.1 TaxID=1502760 RepID=UPI0008C4905E|nr:hypothetical protein [Luteibacter sp. UNCMF331Sha3.1]SEN05552.1 hypothetical protein SAMN02800694_2627 [Luteibacter sp. UNCMF331Sha3.1]
MLDWTIGGRSRPLACTLVLAIVGALGPSAHAATHYLTVINDDAVPATSVEAAPTGTNDYRPLDTAGSLQGGRAGQVMVAFPDGQCVFDLRVTYPDRGPLTVTQWNICRQPTLYLGKARRAGIRQADPH